jgi:hypothetical protein
MRRAARTDANQSAIINALRGVGASVQDLSRVGHGCPDLLVGFRGCNWLLEVKDGSKNASDRKLTSDQVTWHRTWSGQKAVVLNEDEALRAIGAIKL